jgi:uncharacterized membrane protein YkvA (DUF1232 family)
MICYAGVYRQVEEMSMNQPISNPASTGNRWGIVAEIVRNARLVWRLLRDPRVPLPIKLIIPSVVGLYLLSPIDAMPDILPLLGQIDDIAVLLAGAALFIELCPRDVVEEHRAMLTQEARPERTDTHEGETVDAEYRVVE